MKILFIGDVVGKSGRNALAAHLPSLKAKHKPDVTIVNGENAAHGFGLTAAIAQDILECGADVITTGNHTWDQRQFLEEIKTLPRVLRPYNWAKGTPGIGLRVHQLADGKKIVVVNMIGRLFMQDSDCPFQAIDDVLVTHRLGQSCDAIFVDFHCEATSEKQAFGAYCDGRVSAVIGTHTHVPTADERILPKGSAYQTDAGMTGDYKTIIGNQTTAAVSRFVQPWTRQRLEPGEGEGTVFGCLVTLQESGLAKKIVRFHAGAAL